MDLLAAIADRERVARDAQHATGPQWLACPDDGQVHTPGHEVTVVESPCGRGMRDVGALIALHDPAAVMTRCGADREMVELCRAELAKDPARQLAAAVLHRVALGYDSVAHHA